MPITMFRCPPDEGVIKVKECLKPGGCRLNKRCSTLPYLRMVSKSRDWRGVTPSAAGNGPRHIGLKEVINYAVNPYEMSFAALGTGVHGKLSVHHLVKGFVSEQGFDDKLIKAIPDLLEPDEDNMGFYILYDYKTFGSFKVTKALGLVPDKENPKLNKKGELTYYKSGYKKGKVRYNVKQDKDAVDIHDAELQLNRYRIVVEENGYPISSMYIQAIVRDGNTYIAKSREIHEPVYMIPIKRLDNKYVLDFYASLQAECDEFFETGWIRRCSAWESWDGRKCKNINYCPVIPECEQMEKGMKFFKETA